MPVLAAVGLTEWIIAGAIIVGTVVAVIAIRRIADRLARRADSVGYVAQLGQQVATVILIVVALLYAMSVLEVEIGPVLGALGISGVIIGLSLQPVLGNFVGSVMLHGSRPIRPGDQIDTHEVQGTVVEISARAVEVLTFDGTIVHLPNLKVLEEPLTNITHDDERRTSMPFTVSYDADLRTVQQVVSRALREVDGVVDIPGPDVLVTGFGDYGVEFVARFWHPFEELLGRWVISEAVIGIREALQTANITIPYPQHVLHMANPPGESGAGT